MRTHVVHVIVKNEMSIIISGALKVGMYTHNNIIHYNFAVGLVVIVCDTMSPISSAQPQLSTMPCPP